MATANLEEVNLTRLNSELQQAKTKHAHDLAQKNKRADGSDEPDTPPNESKVGVAAASNKAATTSLKHA